MKFKECTCIKCGWVSFAVNKKEATKQVKRFNKYFETLSKKDQQDYYGGKKSSIKKYVCLLCGGRDFRPTKEGDRPMGCTLGPVIWEPNGK